MTWGGGWRHDSKGFGLLLAQQLSSSPQMKTNLCLSAASTWTRNHWQKWPQTKAKSLSQRKAQAVWGGSLCCCLPGKEPSGASSPPPRLWAGGPLLCPHGDAHRGRAPREPAGCSSPVGARPQERPRIQHRLRACSCEPHRRSVLTGRRCSLL